MRNLALHSAEEPDNLRATTGTVEVPTIRDNDAALALGARGQIYKISYDLSQDYLTFIIRSTYDNDVLRFLLEISYRLMYEHYLRPFYDFASELYLSKASRPS